MKLSVCSTDRKVLSFLFLCFFCCFVSHKLKFYATASLNSVSPQVYFLLLLQQRQNALVTHQNLPQKVEKGKPNDRANVHPKRRGDHHARHLQEGLGRPGDDVGGQLVQVHLGVPRQHDPDQKGEPAQVQDGLDDGLGRRHPCAGR